MKKNFKDWLKANTSETPSSVLDERILKRASLTLKTKSSPWSVWIPASGLLAASVLIVFLSMQTNVQKKDFVLNEPFELIEDYDQIELMVEASSWTEEEWKVALGGEET